MTVIDKTYEWAKPLSRRSTTDVLILHHAGVASASPDSIHRTHLGNGWAGIGYHYYICKDGTIYRGRPEDTVGAHAYGANSHSIGVCFEGNYQVEQTMPAAQLAAMLSALAGSAVATLSYPDPLTGQSRAMQAYCGERSVGLARQSGGETVWTGVEIIFMEA